MKNFLFLAFLVFHSVSAIAEPMLWVYEYRGEQFPYTIRSSGDNYNFEFARNPGGETERLWASYSQNWCMAVLNQAAICCSASNPLGG